MVSHRLPLEPDDLLDLPLPDDVSGFELVDGKPVPVSPASPLHGWLIAEVARLLGNHVEERGIDGRVYCDAGFILNLARDPNRMRGPDVAFASAETLRRNPGEPWKYGRFVPELAVEVDVTSGRKPHGRQRIRDYLEAGVRLVWAIEPRTRSATVHRIDGSTLEVGETDALEGEDVVPGFRLPLNALFR